MLTISVDSSALLAALDKFGAAAEKLVKAQAKVTAENIQREARGRVRRATGATGDAITTEETHNGEGYVVFVNQPSNPGLAGWIEFGTVKMVARGFLFSSARLEDGPHLRRTLAAVNEAIDASGLGS